MKKIFAWTVCSIFIIACNNEKPAEEPTAAEPLTETPAVPAPVEFADARYTEIGKDGLAALASGDVDRWMSSFADNAVYFWNNGDSAAGKPAITAYWKKRRTEDIDSISFSNTIWLPVRVSRTQANEQPGVWLLGWYMVDVKYKTGKKMVQWMHMATHFDATDKVDRVIHYLDRAPVLAATKK